MTSHAHPCLGCQIPGVLTENLLGALLDAEGGEQGHSPGEEPLLGLQIPLCVWNRQIRGSLMGGLSTLAAWASGPGSLGLEWTGMGKEGEPEVNPGHPLLLSQRTSCASTPQATW